MNDNFYQILLSVFDKYTWGLGVAEGNKLRVYFGRIMESSVANTSCAAATLGVNMTKYCFVTTSVKS